MQYQDKRESLVGHAKYMYSFIYLFYFFLLATSLAKGGYAFGSVGLSVHLSVCLRTTLLKKSWMDWDEILWMDTG